MVILLKTDVPAKASSRAVHARSNRTGADANSLTIARSDKPFINLSFVEQVVQAAH
jgi:hypothetical protein